MKTATFVIATDAPTTFDAAQTLSDLADLTGELTRALNGAICTFMLRAELEDAFDTAFFRSIMAETPTISGALPLTAS